MRGYWAIEVSVPTCPSAVWGSTASRSAFSRACSATTGMTMWPGSSVCCGRLPPRRLARRSACSFREPPPVLLQRPLSASLLRRIQSSRPSSQRPRALPPSRRSIRRPKPKPVTPMAEEKPGPKAQDPGAASAMPAPAPPEQTNLGAGKCETDQKMADAEVTEEHLKKSNEPEMQQAVEAKKEGEEHSAKAPADVKAQAAQKLQTAQAGATSGTATALDAMHQKKGAALGHVGGDKGAAKARDEAKRAEVSTQIE